MRSNRLLLGLLLTWGMGACADLPHDSPFDVESPLNKQAKATLAGTVKLEGEQDHGQVAVELQNDVRSYTANTRNDGTFELTGVVPGNYTLRFTARSFAPETRELEVGLAATVDLGVVTLTPKTATVQGNAWLEQVAGKASQNVGGVLVSLIQTASVRGGAKSPALRLAASVTGEAQRAFTIVSNADGSYVLYGVPAGTYRASASSPGVAETNIGDVEVTGEEGGLTIDDVVLRPLTGLFDIDDGATLNPPFTAEDTVTLRLFGFNALEMAIDVTTAAGDCLPAVREPYASTRAVPLAGEGANTICVKYFGEGSAETETLTRTVVLDTTPPDATLFQINGGAAASNDALARVTLNIVAADGASGVGAMRLTNAAGGCAAPLAAAPEEPFVSLKSWVLAATPEADNAVCLALRDGAGNWSAPVSTSILWDAVAPSGESVAINGNAVYATSRRVSVQLDAAGAAEMQLTDSGTFTGRPWEPFRAAVDWVLPNVEGAHTIAVRFRDAAGNLSGTAQDDITLDSTPPGAPGLSIDGGAAVTGLASVVLTTSASGAVEMQFSNDGVFDTEARYAIAATHAWSLTAGDGVKTVFARYFDAAGNASVVASAAILRDTAPPVNGAVLIDGGGPLQHQPRGNCDARTLGGRHAVGLAAHTLGQRDGRRMRRRPIGRRCRGLRVDPRVDAFIARRRA